MDRKQEAGVRVDHKQEVRSKKWIINRKLE